jgi:hypothetical protein
MKRIIGITFIVLTVALFSCQNEKVQVNQEDDVFTEKSAQITLTEASLEAVATLSEYEVDFYANAEQMLTRWWRMGKVWQWTNKTHYQLRQCPNVSVQQGDEDGYPKIITLDYGDGTVLKNEKVLSGVIVIEISAPKASGNFNRLVTYDDFGVDTVLINGTSLITVDKSNETYRNMKSDLTFLINNEKEIVRSSVRTWTWLEGMETTDDQTDDVIQIEGTVQASNSDGDTYSKTIVDPLIRMRDCRFIVSGVVEVKLNDIIASTMNYGDGECDAVAVLTNAQGETVEVDLTTCKRKVIQNRERFEN